jgi:phytoene dehydrogenase-like protein
VPFSRRRYDAVVVGSGPNGLSAAIVLAKAGQSVLVLEAKDTLGGGTRTLPLTLPGFVHDVCSAVHPLGISSPFFRSLPLAQHGLEWIHPPVCLAHPFDDGTAAVLERSIDATGSTLGSDAKAYRRLVEPFVARWEALVRDALAPLHLPRHPFLMARFGVLGLQPATWLARLVFRGFRARALFAGIAAHSTMPLDKPPTAAFGLLLGIPGHAAGWPIPRGGSGAIAAALVSYLRSLGGELTTAFPVQSLDDLPPARAVLLDLTPRQVLRVAGDRLPAAYRAQLERFRYSLGTYKIDWALSRPIPWRARECARAGTVHLGGTMAETAGAERMAWEGEHAARPFVLLVQPSLFDPSRAPDGRHTAWAYCHIPQGSTMDMTERIEAQVERFAPGFRDTILFRHTMAPADLEQHNPNLVGGDISGGISDLRQLFFRPAIRLNPYTTPLDGLFICSASTPPGGGVHGMCGYHAARTALKYLQRGR